MTNAFKLIYDVRNYFIIGLYFVFFIAYVVVFILMIKSLKNQYPMYFKEHKKRLYILSTFILSSIFVMILYRLLTTSALDRDFITPALQNNYWDFPLYQFFSYIGMLFIPFAAMLYSLKLAIN